MKISTPHRRSLLFSLLLFAWSTPAAAQWDFDGEKCSPRESQAFEVQTPYVMLMLDKSGSMGGGKYSIDATCFVCRNGSTYRKVSDQDDCVASGDVYEGTMQHSVCGTTSKWSDAKIAIDMVTQDAEAATPKIAEFGLGTFSGSNATVQTDCPSSNTEIMAKLTGSPSGSTPTAAGINRAAQSACFNTDRAAATVLINDGEPTVPSGSAYKAAIDEACGHRKLGPLYVLGFGDGTDEDYNNILAAAGGTGSCDVDPCDDPSNWSSRRGKCTGGLQANNRDDLLDALMDITATLACTLNINFTGAKVTSVPEDADSMYDYLAVEVEDRNTGETHWVCNENHPDIAGPDALCIVNPTHPDCKCDDPREAEGWRFTSPERKFIELSDYYCNNVRTYRYEEAATQLACMCDPAVVGTSCEMPNWTYEGATTCPEGVYVCHYGTEVCEPDTDCCPAGDACDTGLLGVCAEGTIVCDGSHPLGVCVPSEVPSDEICDGKDNDCDGLVDEDLDGYACNTGNPGRCGTGITECIDGDPPMLVCHALGAMPEVCNGIDDDCDGVVDNMDDSWKLTAFEEIRAGLTMEQQAATCNFTDVCVCPDGPADVSLAGTWDDFIAEYYPHCVCGSALEPSSTAGAPAPLGDSTGDSAAPAAACSTTGGAQGGLAVLFGFALVALRRRF